MPSRITDESSSDEYSPRKAKEAQRLYLRSVILEYIWKLEKPLIVDADLRKQIDYMYAKGVDPESAADRLIEMSQKA